MEGDLLSSSGQVWFSLQPKFNSFELDSEVGRLVLLIIKHLIHFFVVLIILKLLNFKFLTLVIVDDCPTSALGPGYHFFPVSCCSVVITGNNSAPSLTAVLDQSLDVKGHVSKQPNMTYTILQDSDQGLGREFVENLAMETTTPNLVETFDDAD